MALSVNSKYGCSMISDDLNQKTAMVFGANGPLSGLDVSKASDTSVSIAAGVAVINGARIESTETINVSVPNSLLSKSKLYVVIEYIHISSEVTFKIVNVVNEKMAILAELTVSSGVISISKQATKLKTLKELADELATKAGPNGVSPDGAGLMSAEDKKKLDGIEEGANKYIHPATHPASMITQTSSMRFVSDTEKSAWNNKINKSDYTVGTNGMLADISNFSAGTNDVLLVSGSGRYRGNNCKNAPTSGVVFYDIENYVVNSKNYRVITARATSGSSYINVYNGSKWSGWGVQYNSNVSHNHDDLYYRKTSFELKEYSTADGSLKITQGSTSFSGTGYSYKMPNGIVMLSIETEVTSMSNQYIDLIISWPKIFPNREDIMCQLSPADSTEIGFDNIATQGSSSIPSGKQGTRVVCLTNKSNRKVKLNVFVIGR